MAQPCRVLIGLTTFASGLVVVGLVLSTALPGFRAAIETPFESLYPGVFDFGSESGCPYPSYH